MTKLYANLCNKNDLGFFFETAEEYTQKLKKARRTLNLTAVYPINIKFVDGDKIDKELFDVLEVHQGNILLYLEAMENWDLDDKVKVFIFVRKLGSSFLLGEDTPDQLDITLYTLSSLEDLAVQFVEDGLYGDIPRSIWCYIDYEAMAYDLRYDYCKLTIAGHDYIYCCD